MHNVIYPVVLCGGSGKRLWPVSRSAYPKQFAQILGSRSLFQYAASRFPQGRFKEPLVVTGESYRFIVSDQLAENGTPATAIIIEPCPRDTGPAILAAALWLNQHAEDALMLVMPSDHSISEPTELRSKVELAADAAQNGNIVTFGIQPTRPETGYGWLEVQDLENTDTQVKSISRFIEKPDQEQANDLWADGNYLWNSGIFLFSIKTLLNAFAKYSPDLLDLASKATIHAKRDLGFVRLNEPDWKKLRSISIDYAIMEFATNLKVVPYSSSWNDLGGWDAVWNEVPKNNEGVSTSGPVLAIDCQDSYLRSDSSNQQLVAIGCENMVAVTMPDAVLIADRSKVQEIKPAVEHLISQGARQAENFPIDRRPWGQFESLALGSQFQVKRITVYPGGKLSLQSHRYRAEHWIVVEGVAKVTIGDQEKLLLANQSIYVPLRQKHRLENPGKDPLVLIEVQTGTYFGEDDIVRYDDAYARE